MTRLQMETTLAVLGYDRRSVHKMQSFNRDLDRLLHRYDRGRISIGEFTYEISLLAAHQEFFSRIEDIPHVVIPELRRMAANAPAHPEDVSIGTTAHFATPEDWIDWDRAFRRDYFWACRRLREYFTPDLPHPDFCRVKMIGTVDSAENIEEELILFGEFQCGLIRDHATTVRSESYTIPIRYLGNANIKRDGYQRSANPIVRHGGFPGIAIETDSDKRIEPGSEVWVDRGNVSVPAPPKYCTEP